MSSVKRNLDADIASALFLKIVEDESFRRRRWVYESRGFDYLFQSYWDSIVGEVYLLILANLDDPQLALHICSGVIAQRADGLLSADCYI